MASLAPEDRLTRYQRFVVFAAWIGLGFDLMDSILFNFVAPIAVPDLLGLVRGAPGTRAVTTYWTGVLTSVMLLGWALGGVIFGRLSDRIGRTRTVVWTMLLFSLGTAACALAPNLALFAVFRFVTALGIGGEWAAGATLVAETVPERRRVQLGALLFTSAPAGVFVAIAMSHLFTARIDAIANNPHLSWRFVMGSGALPAIAALLIRRRLKEPESWSRTSVAERGRILDLFTPALRRRTLGGLTVATVALVTFWVSSAFLPMIATVMAEEVAPHAPRAQLMRLQSNYVTLCMTSFNVGGLLGSLLAAPLAMRFGRRPLFVGYFLWSTVTLLAAFVPHWPPAVRIVLFGVFAVSTYGVFAAFQFYLPELFPSRLRGTGAGFCLNTGRFLTVLGPFVVGAVARRGVPVTDVMRYLALAPAIGLVLLAAGLAVETKHERLESGDENIDGKGESHGDGNDDGNDDGNGNGNGNGYGDSDRDRNGDDRETGWRRDAG